MSILVLGAQHKSENTLYAYSSSIVISSCGRMMNLIHMKCESSSM